MTHDFSGKLLSNRYLLRRCIGLGGMATVYEAVDRELNKLVAVKVLNPQYACQAEYLARFKQEAREAARIRHEHLVDVTDQGTTPDDLAFFVMEFLRGETLQQYLHPTPDRCRQVPWKLMVAVVVQICEALQHAHELGVVHRDIKPGNIFLITRRSGELFVKVLDLGIAKVSQHHRDAAAPPTTRASQGTPGTPEYMSPEQVMGDQCTPSTDLYSLGVVMYRMLTGTLPFYSDRSPYEIMDHHCKLSPPLLRTRAPEAEIPMAVEREVLRALAKRPEDRHGSALELAGALRALAENEMRREARDLEDEDARTHQFRMNIPASRTWARVLSYATASLGGLALSATLFMVLMLVPLPGLEGDAGAVEPRYASTTAVQPVLLASDPGRAQQATNPATALTGAPPGPEPAAVRVPDDPTTQLPTTVETSAQAKPVKPEPEVPAAKPVKPEPEVPAAKPAPKKPVPAPIPVPKPKPDPELKKPPQVKPGSALKRIEQALHRKEPMLSELCDSTKPFPGKERVNMSLAVDTASGSVRNVVITGSQQTSALGTCVRAALLRMKLKQSADGQVLLTLQLTI